MAKSAARTVEAYLAELPPERAAVVARMRDFVNAHLPPGYGESLAFGMIGWGIPLARYPKTYNGQPLGYVALAAQKNGYSLYLMGVYMDPVRERRLRDGAAAAGKTLDMGKSCLRFRSPDALPLEVLGELIAGMPVEEYIALYEAGRAR